MKTKLLFTTALIVLFSANVLSAANDLKQLTDTDIKENDAAMEKTIQPILEERSTTSTTVTTTTTSTTTTIKDIISTPEAEMSITDVKEVEIEPEKPKSIMQWFSKSKTLTITGRPLAYPNPMRGGGVTFQYTLTKDANIEIYIFSMSAEIIRRISCAAGQQGGSEQINKVYWDGLTNIGRNAANGIYWVNIVSKDDGIAIGKIRLTVFN